MPTPVMRDEIKCSLNVVLFSKENEDYVSITDIARHKDSANTDSIIQNWLRNRNTIGLLGFWELMYNPAWD